VRIYKPDTRELTEPMVASSDSTPAVLTKRLVHLFKTVHPKNRGPYTQREAAELINELAGEDVISHQYLGQLCSGRKTDPSARKLMAIADFFGVDVKYFTDDEVAQRTDEELEILRVMRDQGVKSIAFRSSGLSASSMKAVMELIETRRNAEGLGSGDAGTDTP
jgi:transcriptional regulator with XRE-family HTH domain